MPEQVKMLPLEITEDDTSTAKAKGYIGSEWFVLQALACRERQLRETIALLHDVSTEADPAGTLRELRLAQDTIKALEARIAELENKDDASSDSDSACFMCGFPSHDGGCFEAHPELKLAEKERQLEQLSAEVQKLKGEGHGRSSGN